MKTVNVYSRTQALELEPDSNTCLISIWTPKPWGNYDNDLTWTGWSSWMKLLFADISQPYKDWDMFDEDMAGQIFRMLKHNPGSNIAVHCDAGVSRSMAIGCFLRDFLGYELVLNSFKFEFNKNPHVYSILANEYRKYFRSRPT